MISNRFFLNSFKVDQTINKPPQYRLYNPLFSQIKLRKHTNINALKTKKKLNIELIVYRSSHSFEKDSFCLLPKQRADRGYFFQLNAENSSLFLFGQSRKAFPNMHNFHSHYLKIQFCCACVGFISLSLCLFPFSTFSFFSLYFQRKIRTKQ